MRIKLLEDKRVGVINPQTLTVVYDGYCAGSNLDVTEEDARYLIGKGAAVETNEPVKIAEPPPDTSAPVANPPKV